MTINELLEKINPIPDSFGIELEIEHIGTIGRLVNIVDKTSIDRVSFPESDVYNIERRYSRTVLEAEKLHSGPGKDELMNIGILKKVLAGIEKNSEVYINMNDDVEQPLKKVRRLYEMADKIVIWARNYRWITPGHEGKEL